MSEKNIPTWLSHKPIISVDYESKDAYANDAKFLSIGKSTWDIDDISAKIWRKSDSRWSRSSEEMPLWRVLDLAKLVIATIMGKKSSLNETVINSDDIEFLHDFLNENMELYLPRLKEICENEAPRISPPFAFSISKTCCGAETAKRQPVHRHINKIETKGFSAKKKISTSAIQATSCVSAATLAGENLSDNFPPRKLPAHMPAPASTIIKETNLGEIPDTLTNKGFM